MSPIRAEERARYPEDWPVISADVRHFRAEGRCQCRGECGAELCDAPRAEDGRCRALNRGVQPVTGALVVLTVAHLNHVPEDVSWDNLRAFCQFCHLHYDREHHAETRAARALAPA